MKIGFDVSQTGANKTGCGYFADALISHLARLDSHHRYDLYPTFGLTYWDENWLKSTRHIKQENFRRGVAQDSYESLEHFWRLLPISEVEKRLDYPTIIHANNFFCPVGLTQSRLVYTLYDLSFMQYPETTKEEWRATYFLNVFNASVYADSIIAISEYTRAHFLSIFPHCSPDKVSVVYPGCRLPDSALAISKPPSLLALNPNGFWLTVGTIEPRKNHKRLLQAYARLKLKGGSVLPLVLAGGQGWLMDDFQKEVEQLNLTNDVVRLGYVDDNTLQWLYQNCFAFIYPSLFEGFGLPVLEAMSAGAAVITSNVSSLPEVAGEAGLLIDPLREESLYQAMHQLTISPDARRDLQHAARLQSKKFSWEKSARQVLNLYETLEKHG